MPKSKGFFKAYSFIFDMGLSPKAKIVYFYFCRLSSGAKQVYPSHKTTSIACNLCVSAVRLGIDELEEKGLIKRIAQYRESKGQKSNLYTLVENINNDNPADPNIDNENLGSIEIEEKTSVAGKKVETENLSLSNNSTPHSQIIVPTPVINCLTELRNIIINIHNDLKLFIFKRRIYIKDYEVDRTTYKLINITNSYITSSLINCVPP